MGRVEVLTLLVVLAAATAGFVVWMLGVQSSVYRMGREITSDAHDFEMQQRELIHSHEALCRWVRSDLHRAGDFLDCDISEPMQ